VDGQIVALLPVAAGVFAVPQFVPQLLRVRRRGLTAGVSWTWAMMTCINNAAWAVYFVWSRFYSALIPASAAVVFSGLLAVQLAVRMDGFPRRSALIVAGWSAVMALAGTGFGRVGLGTVLAAAFLLQVMPSVWTACQSKDLSGVSVGTWLLVFGELACFGLFGLAEHDPRLIVLGMTGVCASILMLTRVAVVASSDKSGNRLTPPQNADLGAGSPQRLHRSWQTPTPEPQLGHHQPRRSIRSCMRARG
jgi:uncharacterized protein with PQ loop repeat